MSRAADEAPQAAFHEDRRLLGRLLGEVIREQAGAGTLERIEGIRQTAVRFRRAETAHDAITGPNYIRKLLPMPIPSIREGGTKRCCLSTRI